MGNELDRTDGEKIVGQVLSTVTDDVVAHATGIPPPVRKNALIAFARLCAAAVEYPVGLLQDAIEEHHAESRGRVKLIETSASQIAGQMQTSPEYARVAVAKFGRKILRERVNIDLIADVAAEQLKSEPSSTSDDSEPEAALINEDWLNAFEDEAAKMSSDHMQRLFGRILAGEIRKPTSYSIKTVKLMAQLDNRAATLFQLTCSLSMSLRVQDQHGVILVDDVRVVSMGHAASNSLRPYGLAFDALNILQEYGLIISDYNSFMPYAPAIARNGQVAMPVTYQGKQWAFTPKDPTKIAGEFPVHGVALSRSGRELLSIIDFQPHDAYTTALMKYFATQGMTMTPTKHVPDPAA